MLSQISISLESQTHVYIVSNWPTAYSYYSLCQIDHFNVQSTIPTLIQGYNWSFVENIDNLDIPFG